MFKIYKGQDVVVEGESPLTITGLEPNTDVAAGAYQAVRIDGDKESDRVDVPAFKTLPISVTSVELTPNSMTGTQGEASNRQMTAKVSPENATNKSVAYKVDEAEGLTINASGVLAWTANTPAGTYTVTATTADGNKTDTSTLTINEPPEPEPEPDPEEPED